jgi:hypothetical protein
MTQNVMSGYYGQPYQQPIEPNPDMDQFMHQGMSSDMVQGMVDTTMVGAEGQTLDQIISQNDLELQRRRSTLNPDYRSDGDQETHEGRPSMMDFASSKHPDAGDFRFAPSPPHASMPGQIGDTGQSQKASDPRKLRSRENLALDTRFHHMNPAFVSMSTYSPTMMSSTPLDLDHASQFLSSNMEIPMNFDAGGGNRTPMNIQPQIEQQALYTASPTHQTFSPMFPSLNQEAPAGHPTAMEQSLMEKVARIRMPESLQNMSLIRSQGTSPPRSVPTARGSGVSILASPAHPSSSNLPPGGTADIRSPFGNGSKLDYSEKSAYANMGLDLDGSVSEAANYGLGKPPDPQFTNIYSSSGFDMLGVLVSVDGIVLRVWGTTDF